MKKIKIFFFICSAIFFLGLIIYAFLGPFFKISLVKLNRDPELQTNKSYRAQEEEIASYLNRYKGQLLWRVDLKDLVKKVNSLYLGTEVYTARRFPNQLNVSLKKKNTALLLLKGGEFFYSVSHEGEIGAKRTGEESFDFPILRGDSFGDNIQLRKRALSVLSSIPKAGRDFSAQNISEISYNKANDSLLFYLSSGHFILELRKQLFPKAIQNIEFVLNYLNQQGEQGRLIDVHLDKKIIVKMGN